MLLVVVFVVLVGYSPEGEGVVVIVVAAVVAVVASTDVPLILSLMHWDITRKGKLMQLGARWMRLVAAALPFPLVFSLCMLYLCLPPLPSISRQTRGSFCYGYMSWM